MERRVRAHAESHAQEQAAGGMYVACASVIYLLSALPLFVLVIPIFLPSRRALIPAFHSRCSICSIFLIFFMIRFYPFSRFSFVLFCSVMLCFLPRHLYCCEWTGTRTRQMEYTLSAVAKMTHTRLFEVGGTGNLGSTLDLPSVPEFIGPNAEVRPHARKKQARVLANQRGCSSIY